MQVGSKVHILPSRMLVDLKLKELSGRTGTVMEIVSHNGKIKGCWVRIDGKVYLEEPEWYIPYASLIEL